jgi:hypothetical protein
MASQFMRFRDHTQRRSTVARTPLDECKGVKAPGFQDNWHIKVVRLSTLRIGRLYPLGIILGTHFLGIRGGVVVEALRYKPEGRGFDSRWCHWNFSLT